MLSLWGDQGFCLKAAAQYELRIASLEPRALQSTLITANFRILMIFYLP
jgi:hypothetical protein